MSPPSALLARITIRLPREEHDLVEQYAREHGTTMQTFILGTLRVVIEQQRKTNLERLAVERRIARAAARRLKRQAGPKT